MSIRWFVFSFIHLVILNNFLSSRIHRRPDSTVRRAYLRYRASYSNRFHPPAFRQKDSAARCVVFKRSLFKIKKLHGRMPVPWAEVSRMFCDIGTGRNIREFWSKSREQFFSAPGVKRNLRNFFHHIFIPVTDFWIWYSEWSPDSGHRGIFSVPLADPSDRLARRIPEPHVQNG